ncbi:signal peptidase I [Thalassotalea sp. M1531]|uniref:Signal peptidase I n=1 Tax=Thalassotalea algicola TaxID=2716224 RepID=A0A7Y0Q6E4_9GAMM|nr:signal peptidase I [Thalassotalea algicola]
MIGKFTKLAKDNRGFILFLVLMSVFRSAVADWNDVPTGSMNPTIVEGDRIFINKMAYDVRLPFTHISLMQTGEPSLGDVVIFDSKASDKRLVKRVIGVPGDVIAMKDNTLLINGQPAEYDIIDHAEQSIDYLETTQGVSYRVRKSNANQPYDSFSEVEVPQGHYLVLGDNRDNSADSRFIGFVPRNEIVGQSQSVAFSLDYDNYFLPRVSRFFSSLD